MTLTSLPYTRFSVRGNRMSFERDLRPHSNFLIRDRFTLKAASEVDATFNLSLIHISFPNRKILAAALEARIAHNAAALRQGDVYKRQGPILG